VIKISAPTSDLSPSRPGSSTSIIVARSSFPHRTLVCAHLRLPAVHHRGCRSMCIFLSSNSTFIMTILLISYSKALILIHSPLFLPMRFSREVYGEYFWDLLIPTLLHTIIESITLIIILSAPFLRLYFWHMDSTHSFIH